MATLNFNLRVDGLEDGTLVVREYHGSDSLSQSRLDDGNLCHGYRYELALASRKANLTADQVVDKAIQLEIELNGQIVQRVHGIARNFTKGDTGHHHTFYALTLVPALERLSLRHNSRIFQLKTVP
ncbi:contractile injection system protein, VgrG/Pvc8 family, partial [Vibrio sp. TRT 21S02]|uniref:contractile injection system protein, VgrG/Pvc8 family n=1 Tax=Vibrio sp. TRT 21S02 TaxID=3418507 RepID=UPI003CEA4CE6